MTQRQVAPLGAQYRQSHHPETRPPISSAEARADGQYSGCRTAAPSSDLGHDRPAASRLTARLHLGWLKLVRTIGSVDQGEGVA